jgi:hypothetical protein
VSLRLPHSTCRKKADKDKAAAAAEASQPAALCAEQLGDGAAELLDQAAISQYEFEDGVMIASRHRFAKVSESGTHAHASKRLSHSSE